MSIAESKHKVGEGIGVYKIYAKLTAAWVCFFLSAEDTEECTQRFAEVSFKVVSVVFSAGIPLRTLRLNTGYRTTELSPNILKS